MNKKLSVVISIYNKEKSEYFNQCMHSITSPYQTLPPDEIILVIDGPINVDLENTIKYWQEKPINLKIIRNKENLGLAKSLNNAIPLCRNELIARMDTDDESLPERFEKQYKYMSENPEIAASSGAIEEFDQDLKKCIGVRDLPTTHESIAKFAKIRSPLNHPASIFRKSAILDVGGYPNFYPEDYALWGTLIAKGYYLGNISDVLLRMRIGDALNKRRGANFLKGEIKTYFLFKNLGLLKTSELIKSIVAKSVIRLMPAFLKRIFYKHLR